MKSLGPSLEVENEVFRSGWTPCTLTIGPIVVIVRDTAVVLP